ncbi:MAG: polysaccharide deacetylase family protein [Alphaproteobacteria bacterium]|nr:polysaccharide deacetylase family protein [Alphaproteobacteria bacterium]
MPWKDRYTISDERSLTDAEVTWPEGRHCAFTVVVDMSVARGPAGITAADLAANQARFGAGDGLEQLLGVLDRHAIKATFVVPAVIAAAQAESVRALAKAGHEIAAGGFRHEDVTNLPRDEEARRIAATSATIAEITGMAPTGWYSLPRPEDNFAVGTISPNTMDLLLEAGYRYFGNSPADDIPHWWVTDFAARRAILAMPYYYHFDDQWFLLFPAKGTGLEHADFLARNWRAEFDAQYKRGRMFSMVLHPMHIGWSHRLALLDAFLGYATGRPGVWAAPAGAVATHWHATFPAATHLRLEPSIWQDYSGSLS